MAIPFTNLTSIHGRRIAISATGAIVDRNGFGAIVADASGVLQNTVKIAAASVSSSGAVIPANGGITSLASGTATSQTFTMSAPSSGLGKEIFSLSSATTITIETSATTITFVTTGASSSALTFSGSGGVFGESLVLRGLSSTRWAVLNKTAQIT